MWRKAIGVPHQCFLEGHLMKTDKKSFVLFACAGLLLLLTLPQPRGAPWVAIFDDDGEGALAIYSAGPVHGGDETEPQFVPEQILVRFKEGTTTEGVDRLVHQFEGIILRAYQRLNLYHRTGHWRSICAAQLHHKSAGDDPARSSVSTAVGAE